MPNGGITYSSSCRVPISYALAARVELAFSKPFRSGFENWQLNRSDTMTGCMGIGQRFWTNSAELENVISLDFNFQEIAIATYIIRQILCLAFREMLEWYMYEIIYTSNT